MNPRLRIKYCGGCNPDYDRIALVEEMKARLTGVVEWVAPEADPLDGIVAVNGCATACADLTAFAGHEIYPITCREDLGPLIEAMRLEK